MNIKGTRIAPTLQYTIPLLCHNVLVKVHICFHIPEVVLYPMDDPNIHARVCAKSPIQTPTHISLATQRYIFFHF